MAGLLDWRPNIFMIENLVHFLRKILPPEIIIVMIASMPISELRGAIPFGVCVFGFSPVKAFLLSLLGNSILVVPLLLLLDSIAKYCAKYKYSNKLINWWFEGTRKRSKLVEKYESIGLAIFVAIPFPLTGAWSGCVASYLLGIRFWYALIAILSGVIIAGIIVTLTTLGIVKII